jgi:hypothetical protein
MMFHQYFGEQDVRSAFGKAPSRAAPKKPPDLTPRTPRRPLKPN